MGHPVATEGESYSTVFCSLTEQKAITDTSQSRPMVRERDLGQSAHLSAGFTGQ